MATGPINGILQHLCRSALLQDGVALTDGQLLERFLARHEEAAFELLVRRHGPMVLGVCRRLLRNAHDAEDAFQATFLVLVKKAASLLRRAGVGNWLYGVAYHTALKARAAAVKRRAREAQVSTMPGREPTEDASRDWQPLLDQELTRLPEKYREAVVLCDLEGMTRRDAARQMGVPEGTLSGRLTTARRMLARRLARHGLALSGGALAMVLSQSAASACVPVSLVTSTIRAAVSTAAGQTATAAIAANVAALTEGVLKAMLVTRLKVMATFVVVVGLVALAGGMFAHSALAGPAGDRPAAAVEQPRPPTSDLLVAQRPRQEPVKDGTTVAGNLESVDPGKNAITISIFSRKEGESTAKTFTVAKDAKILKDGVPAKLADLKRGRATLRLSEDQTTALSISVAGRTATGEFFDSGKKTITIAAMTRNMVKENRTHVLAKDVKVTIDGKAATLQDLKDGTRITLTFSADGDAVIQIQTAPPAGRERQ